MPIETFPLGPLETNCHLVYNNHDAIVIDPGGDLKGGLPDVLEFLKRKNLTLQAIVCTHGHFDHIYGVANLQAATGAKIVSPPKDDPMMHAEMTGSGTWGFPPVKSFEWEPLMAGPHDFGSLHAEVLDTPGHTPGSVSLYFQDMSAICTGDLLFYRSVGRTDFPGGDYETLKNSIHQKVFTLPPATEVYPGHGPNTIVGDEKTKNPFV